MNYSVENFKSDSQDIIDTIVDTVMRDKVAIGKLNADNFVIISKHTKCDLRELKSLIHIDRLKSELERRGFAVKKLAFGRLKVSGW